MSLFMSECVFVALDISTGAAVSYCKQRTITGIIGKASTRLQPCDSNTVQDNLLTGGCCLFASLCGGRKVCLSANVGRVEN